jgi:hypothetical protein
MRRVSRGATRAPGHARGARHPRDNVDAPPAGADRHHPSVEGRIGASATSY